MLDNPDKYGIYPTTKCFNRLDALFDRIVEAAQKNNIEAEPSASDNTESMSLQLAEQSYKCAVCGCSEFDLK